MEELAEASRSSKIEKALAKTEEIIKEIKVEIKEVKNEIVVIKNENPEWSKNIEIISLIKSKEDQIKSYIDQMSILMGKLAF